MGRGKDGLSLQRCLHVHTMNGASGVRELSETPAGSSQPGVPVTSTTLSVTLWLLRKISLGSAHLNCLSRLMNASAYESPANRMPTSCPLPLSSRRRLMCVFITQRLKSLCNCLLSVCVVACSAACEATLANVLGAPPKPNRRRVSSKIGFRGAKKNNARRARGRARACCGGEW